MMDTVITEQPTSLAQREQFSVSMAKNANLPPTNNPISPTKSARTPRSRYSLTYADWITRALMAAKDKCACLSDIYEWMAFHVPGLQEQRFLHSSKGWKNAVRHTLSINPRFRKLKRLGKPALWTLADDYLRQAQALTKISLNIPPTGNGNGTVDQTNVSPSEAERDASAKIICYAGKNGASTSPLDIHEIALQQQQQQRRNSDVPKFDLPTALNVTWTASAPVTTVGTAEDTFPHTNALFSEIYKRQMPMTTACPERLNPTITAHAPLLPDLSALQAQLNALVASTGNVEADLQHLHQQRLSAAAAAAAAHLTGGNTASLPTLNFMSSQSPGHQQQQQFCIGQGPNFASYARRGSGDSTASTASSASGSGTLSVVESLRSLTQTLDVTTLTGLETTLVLPRPLPIQCLTDQKLLLASLIWSNPAAVYF